MNLILTAILPVFGIMAVGTFAEKMKFLGKESHIVLSNFVYYIALPLLIFSGISSHPIKQVLNIPFLFASFLGLMIPFAFILLFYSIKSKKYTTTTIMRAFAVGSPNNAFMGVPILLPIFGQQALLPVAVGIILLTIVLLISVTLIELKSKDKESTVLKTIFQTLYRNPIVIAIVAGFIFSILGIKLPGFIGKICDLLGMTAGPCAMFVVGQTLAQQKLYPKKIIKTIPACFFKLIVVPIITLAFLLLFNIDPFWGAAGLLLNSMPVAVTVYIIAQKYNVYSEEASTEIIISTIASFFTLSALILIIPHIWPTLSFF